MNIELIKETENFKLIFKNLGEESASHLDYEIYRKYKDSEEKICLIYRFFDDARSVTTLCAQGSGIQDCITTWELYKEFIMLVDDAYERIDLDKAKQVVLD